ncbi:MAG: ABC transporter permease [Anaerovoracaceae bacterium]|jgi:glycine betaine/proline transport system permease protein
MPKIPLGDWIDSAVRGFLAVAEDSLDAFSKGVDVLVKNLYNTLEFIPWWLLILIVVAIAWKATGWRLALGTAIGLGLIYNLKLWSPLLDTITMVIFASIFSIIIGIPLGIAGGRNNVFHKIISPILDFMQTMPAFVYLIPSLMFFGIGKFAAIFAIVIFAMPPIIRFTDLGIRQVPTDLVEVGEAFGSTPTQLLFKVQIPVAKPTILAGLNQTMMLALSMVVITAMIGAGGLGEGVLYAIGQMQIGMGFEYGIAVVILAIILDRLTQSIGRSKRPTEK